MVLNQAMHSHTLRSLEEPEIMAEIKASQKRI